MKLLGSSVTIGGERWQVSFNPILLLVIIAFLFNLGPTLARFYDWNYDSWAHMFFASHYMNSWFDTWEPRWFGGFSVTSYPPLVTQLLALSGFVMGLENAYTVLSLSAMVLVPVAVYCFSALFLTRQQATWAGLLSILLPSIYLTNYTYGQLPALIAAVTSLFMGTFLWRYLKEGHSRDVWIAALLAGVTAASHHTTFISFASAISATVSAIFVFKHGWDGKTLLKRLGIFGVIVIPLALIPIFPFWQFFINTTPQTPILNLSRVNLFTNTAAFLQFFLAPYFLFLLAVPAAVIPACRQKYLIPLFVIFSFFFVLGLGGSTPLPKLVFGHWWQWQTYEKPALWAGILLMPLTAMLLPAGLVESGKKSIRPAVLVLTVSALIVASAFAAFLGSEPVRRSFLPSPPAVDPRPFVEFLDGPDVGQEYRYITLGFGEAQMERLSTMTQARNLDGTYYTARTLPVLTQSGIASLDAIKHFDPELKTLDAVLEDAEAYSLKWVLVNDPYFYRILEEHGFVLTWSAATRLDVRYGGVTIWVKEGVPPITGEGKTEKGLASYVWGVAPLALLAALFLLLLWGPKGRSKPGSLL